jgi:hypothetical protein
MMWTTVRGFTDCCSSITVRIKTGKRDEGEMLSYPAFVGYGRDEEGGREDQGMSDENGPKDVAHYCHPPFVAPEIGEQPPVGAWIAKDAVCRDCMTAVEEISMRRGFVDPIPAKEAQAKECACSRCGKALSIPP